MLAVDPLVEAEVRSDLRSDSGCRVVVLLFEAVPRVLRGLAPYAELSACFVTENEWAGLRATRGA